MSGENGGLFGFMEQGYREAIVLEAAMIVLLRLFVALNEVGGQPSRLPDSNQ